MSTTSISKFPLTNKERFVAYGCLTVTDSGAINFYFPERDISLSGTDTVTHEHLYLSLLYPDNYVTVVGDNTSAANVLEFQAQGAKIIHMSQLFEFLYPEDFDHDGECEDEEDFIVEVLDAF